MPEFRASKLQQTWATYGLRNAVFGAFLRPRQKAAVLLGDVGSQNGIFHAGDEAMLFAAIAQLRKRGFNKVSVVTANPNDTEARYGVFGLEAPSVNGLIAPGFLEDFIQVIRDGSRELGDIDSKWFAVWEKLRTADLAVISGGGNLNDTWPMGVVLRRAFAELSHQTKVPLAVTSQSVGPHLSGESWNHVSRIIELSAAFSVREDTVLTGKSGDLHALDTRRIELVPDDAAFIEARQPGSFKMKLDELPDELEYVVASFHPHPGDLREKTIYFDACVEILLHALSITGLPIVLLPQEANFDPSTESKVDLLFLEELRDSLRNSPIYLSYEFGIETSVALIAGASLVLSTRYHPVVWALANAVPVCGFSVDEYTKAKISGAMRLFHNGAYFFDLRGIVPGVLANHVKMTWEQRKSTSATLRKEAVNYRGLQNRWWDSIVEREFPSRNK